MRSTLIQIGNSRGVRLPKSVIEEAELGSELDLQVVDGAVIIRSAHTARQGWAAAAEACQRENEDDFSDWDATTNDFEGPWQ